MDGTIVDPRVIADALQMDTKELARVLTTWSGEALPMIGFNANWIPTSLDNFDENVSRSRRYLEAAHEAMRAWDEDQRQ
jgi:hypothetical protein